MDYKPIGSVSLHHCWSQMSMVKAMTITVDNLRSRPKLDYDVGYDVAMKGASVVVHGDVRLCATLGFLWFLYEAQGLEFAREAPLTFA